MLLAELIPSLHESFNQGLPIRWDDASNEDVTLYYASFYLNDGMFIIQFKHLYYDPIWKISFTRNNVFDLTKTKSAFIVLSSVMQAIREFVQHVNPRRIELEADMSEVSRLKLYPKLIAMMQREFPQYAANPSRTHKTLSGKKYHSYKLERPVPEWVPPPPPPKPDYSNDPPLTDDEWAEMERSLRM